jgi:hypothetical protein
MIHKLGVAVNPQFGVDSSGGGPRRPKELILMDDKKWDVKLALKVLKHGKRWRMKLKVFLTSEELRWIRRVFFVIICWILLEPNTVGTLRKFLFDVLVSRLI